MNHSTQPEAPARSDPLTPMLAQLREGSCVWLSELLDAGKESGLSARQTVRRATGSIRLAAIVAVEWSPGGRLPRAQEVILSGLGFQGLPMVEGFDRTRAGRAVGRDKFAPFAADLLADRSTARLEQVAQMYEAQPDAPATPINQPAV
jgi:hypothetical protein